MLLLVTLVGIGPASHAAGRNSRIVPAQVSPASPPALSNRNLQGVGPNQAQKRVVKNPRRMAEQLIAILKMQKSPWQLYTNYARIYVDFAAGEAAKRPANKRAAAQQAWLVGQLREMGRLLQNMGMCAKVRSDIRVGISQIPFDKRQEEYSKATVLHATLLKQFAALAVQLPTSFSPNPNRMH